MPNPIGEPGSCGAAPTGAPELTGSGASSADPADDGAAALVGDPPVTGCDSAPDAEAEAVVGDAADAAGDDGRAACELRSGVGVVVAADPAPVVRVGFGDADVLVGAGFGSATAAAHSVRG